MELIAPIKAQIIAALVQQAFRVKIVNRIRGLVFHLIRVKMGVVVTQLEADTPALAKLVSTENSAKRIVIWRAKVRMTGR